MTNTSSGRDNSKWIVSPLFDLLFLANILWLLALMPGFVTADGTVHLEFWQIYFLTTPHRWITLPLVVTDPDRRCGRSKLMITLAVLFGLLIAGVWLGTRAFTCLLIFEYTWNAWHFASQHAGILRIYSHKSGGGPRWLESTALRIFIVYVILRIVPWATGWTHGHVLAQTVLSVVDVGMFAIPLALWIREAVRGPWRRPGKTAYLASVTLLYGSVLVAMMGDFGLVLAGLVVATAAFHSVEYLAIVTFYAWRRREQGSASLFQQMSRRWLQVLVTFVVVLGTLSVIAEESLQQWWIGLNLWIAFLHYSYDGIIWKLRRSETASKLGIASSAAAGGN